MKSNVLCDIKTAASVFGEVRKARKSGAEIEMQKVKKYPVLFDTAGILSTVEGCTLINKDKVIFKIAQEAFSTLPYEDRHRLTFVPKQGEFADRVQFWKDLLMPVMSDKQFHLGMQAIIRWYIHIKREDLVKGGMIHES